MTASISNYQISAPIYESANSIVYRAVSLGKRQPVILKVLKQDYPTPSELTRYKQEYEITRSLDIGGVIKVYALLPYESTLAMVIEDFGGQSLDIYLKNHTLGLSEFLELGISVATTLSDIHAANIIHKDINPNNIVFNPTTGQVKIIDFGISSRFTREHPTINSLNTLEGTLAYISPEQTGRMNRTLDYRTDLYSLGVTFYRILTDHLPFETYDPLEVVHAHIAKQPTPPEQVNLAIPKVISDMVMKLMGKTAEDRYQNASGLRADLQECLNQLQTSKQILPFELGQQDFSDQFQIPQKLYGREAEIDHLLTVFNKVTDKTTASIRKQPEMMLVSGYSGIGKSALIQELYKPITQQRGYFISGKFDQFQRNIPYSAVIQAFTSLTQQLLSEGESQLALWRDKFQSTLESNGQVIIDIVPELEQIIGPQPTLQSLDAQEAQNRFNTTFQKFIRVFCRPEHPLVLFLDDWQWADIASLRLLELIVTDAQIEYLFLLGAYRDNEVDVDHPAYLTIERIKKKEGIVHHISVEPLGISAISQLLQDSLRRNLQDVNSLANLVLQKTSGNPFFANEFLKTLYQSGLLRFDFVNQCWQWDIAELEAVDITDNVVDLILSDLKRLSASTQTVLQMAACIGNFFDLKTLAIIYGKSLNRTFDELSVAVQEGIIKPMSPLETISETSAVDVNLVIHEYQFRHDRLQQAAYELISEDQRIVLHLQIGRLLLQNSTQEFIEENVFTIVDHFNKGNILLENKTEKLELVQLNFIAGKKAKAATAYNAARDYLFWVEENYPGEMWLDDYPLALEFYRELAEIQYLNGDFESSQAIIQLSLQQAQSILDCTEFHFLKIMQYTLRGQCAEAVESGRVALKLLGVDLPSEDFQSFFEREIAEYHHNIKTRTIPSLYNSQEMTVKEKRDAVQILSRIFPAAWIFNPILMCLVATKIVNLNLKYGHMEKSAMGYSYFGVVGSAVLQDYRLGYSFGELGLKLSARYQDWSSKCVANLLHGNFTKPWLEHIKYSEDVNFNGVDAGMQGGDLQVVGYIFTYRLFNSLYQGKSLKGLLKEALRDLKFSKESQNQWSVNCIEAAKNLLDNLLGLTQHKLSFDPNNTSESSFLANCQTSQTPAAVCFYYIFKSQVLYLYDQSALSLQLGYLQKSTQLLNYIPGFISAAKHNFYYSLTLIDILPDVSEEEQKKYLELVQNNQQKMKQWADLCPDNFLHKYLLVEAEIARIFDRYYDAIQLYDQAIASSKQYGFVQNEALANELAAKFWLGQGKEDFAAIYMRRAHQGYQIWEAIRKVELMEETYPQWFAKATHRRRLTTTSSSSSEATSGEGLDLEAILKATQAISGAVGLENLIAELMQIVFANAGAQQGFLLLEKNGTWVIEFAGSVNEPEPSILKALSIDSTQTNEHIPLLSAGIIHYVVRTHKDIVLTEATQTEQFTHDPYIVAVQPKSVLCLPLLDQGELNGILYLENNLVAGAFTEERVKILKILSAQAAISIKNARLYDRLESYSRTLEQKVEVRTQELSDTLEILKATQAELVIENQLLRSVDAPSTDYYQVGGSLAIDAPTYVVRQADRQLYQALQRHQYCYIFNARQMGKSSLRVQMMKRLQAEGFTCVSIDLSVIGNRQTTLEQWYAGFIYALLGKLNLLGHVDIRTWWHEHSFIPPVQRLNELIHQVVLRHITEQIIIFIDEVDSVISLNFPMDDFFVWMRACFNQRADKPQYARLTFVLLGVTTPSQLLQDKQRTPFNIGQAIELKGFQPHEAHPLLRGLTDKLANPQRVLRQILSWTNGQPFLSQKVCKMLAQQNEVIPESMEQVWVDELVRSQLIENWETKDNPEHFRTIRDRLLIQSDQRHRMLEIYQQLLSSVSIPVDDSLEHTDLLLSGLVINQENKLCVANRLYASIFDQIWVKQMLDDLNPG